MDNPDIQDSPANIREMRQEDGKMKKMTREQVRSLIKTGALWLVGICAFRLVTLIFYSIVFASGVNVAVDYDKDVALARRVVVGTSFAAWGIFMAVWLGIRVRNNGEERRRVIAAAGQPGFSVARFCLGYWPGMAVRVALLALTQLVFCGFFAAFGYKFSVESGSTLIERFHIADAGWYLLTGVPILGLLLNILFSALSLYAMHMASVALWRGGRDV